MSWIAVLLKAITFHLFAIFLLVNNKCLFISIFFTKYSVRMSVYLEQVLPPFGCVLQLQPPVQVSSSLPQPDFQIGFFGLCDYTANLKIIIISRGSWKSNNNFKRLHIHTKSHCFLNACIQKTFI